MEEADSGTIVRRTQERTQSAPEKPQEDVQESPQDSPRDAQAKQPESPDVSPPPAPRKSRTARSLKVVTDRPMRKRQEELYEEESPSPPPAAVRRRRTRKELDEDDIRAEPKRLKTEVRALKKPTKTAKPVQQEKFQLVDRERCLV
jgi:hypothetical protein